MLYCTAAKGHSPFAVLLSDEDAASMNETMEALDSATNTTAKGYKSVTKTLPAVPEEAFEFLLVLKTFAIVLYAFLGAAAHYTSM